MPWIDKDECIGCGICVEKCPVKAISIEGKKAKIKMEECIHCGTCYSMCPQEAVRHDGGKIPEEIKTYAEKTKKFIEARVRHPGQDKEGQKCLK